MAKAHDRRKHGGKTLENDRRKSQRRRSTKIFDETPVRRDEDWDRIDSEFNH